MAKILNAPNVEVSRNPSTNVISKLRGTFVLPPRTVAGDESEAVLSFLKENAADLQFDTLQTNLALVQKTSLPTANVFRYQQLINSVPVYDSYVLVQTGDNAVKQIDLSMASTAAVAAPPASQLSADEATRRATAAVGSVELRSTRVEPKLWYFKARGGLRLAYEVLVLTQNPMHDWQLFVDAQTGEILQKMDIIQHLPDGTGMVFEPNPVVTAHDNTLRQPTATAAGCGFAGTALATIDAQRVSRTLRDLTLSGGKFKLEGPFAKIVEINSPTSAIPEEASATAFNYSSSDERFGAVNLYYNIDTIQRYVQSLGITTANNRQTSADPTCNSSGYSAFYSPGDKCLHMGISRPCNPDKAQESEAIVHEYGHAIQDNQVPGWGTPNPTTGRYETRAMGEGFGDILACVFFASFGGGFQREVFEDWAYSTNGTSGLRRVDGTKVYPTNWLEPLDLNTNNPKYREHENGEIWSAALWNIYRAIGGDSVNLADRNAARDALLKTVIQSHHLLLPSASMPDAAEAILRTHADAPEYRGQYLLPMLTSFHDRGILACSASADLFIHDTAADAGAETTTGNFWNSPDLWITNTDVPNSTAANHVNPEHGQDNWFHAKVTNKGTQTARAFVVTFNVKAWAGTQFVYPADFTTSFVSAAVGFNLAPGASTVVKAKWPAGMVPPVGTHACWLSSVFMPTDPTAAGKHVWESNNLAQKNLTIVDLKPGDSFIMPFQLANSLVRLPQKLRLEVLRPREFANAPVSILHSNQLEISKLFSFTDPIAINPRIGAIGNQPLAPISPLQGGIKVAVGPVATPVAIGGSATQTAPLTASGSFLARQSTLSGNEISFAAGLSAGFPVVLQPGQLQTFNLKVAAPATARPGDSFDINLVQRDENNTITGGITVTVNVRG